MSTCAHAGVRIAIFSFKILQISQISSSCWILNWDLRENAVFATNLSGWSFFRDCMQVIRFCCPLETECEWHSFIFLRSPPVIGAPRTLIVSPRYIYDLKQKQIQNWRKNWNNKCFSPSTYIYQGEMKTMKMWFKTSLLLRTIYFHLKFLFRCWISHFGSFKKSLLCDGPVKRPVNNSNKN